MGLRFKAVEVASARSSKGLKPPLPSEVMSSSERFGLYVFGRPVMERMLPPEVYRNAVAALESKEHLNPEYADIVASAMKEWAVGLGATHYTHWFQPLTGSTAEKHDSFIEWSAPGNVIERFCGKQLIQGEPDASSFPSGGLRTTYEARGYTGWDPTSPVFVWKGGDGVTLCIPSVFFSWTGETLDTKIPLLRSDSLLNDAVVRLCQMTGAKAERAYSTLGWEQEYFVVDRALRNLRPDLVMLGKTVFGAPAAKGQELQDHYFAAVKERILAFMQDFENLALQLSIPVKTRHNEVAPAQHEVAAVYEQASVASDHNILLMHVMRKVAERHNLACLLHEKPFEGLNGSGKHNNWSIATDTGLNLLTPTDCPVGSLRFLILLSAILYGVHENADVLLASIASAGNDSRLGGHEAPPAIFSVYLGEKLEALLEDIEKKGVHRGKRELEGYDLGLPVVPQLSRDNTDRNRTSPFAFTGNKFEFRAVGSNANCAPVITVINGAVAKALNKILDEIQANVGSDANPSQQALTSAALPVIRKYLKKSKKVRFSGDNYCKEWEQEAQKRKLAFVKSAPEAYAFLKSKKAQKLFEEILTKEELASRYEILMESYSLHKTIEANLMVEMFRTQILPSALAYQGQMVSALQGSKELLGKISSTQKRLLEELSQCIDQSILAIDEVFEVKEECATEGCEQRALLCADKLAPLLVKARKSVDQLELMVDDKLWPIPKYRELLFLV